MGNLVPEWKRETRRRLVSAVEEALGVSGPRALGRETARGGSWWSKLLNGRPGAEFPDWQELRAILPAGLPDERLAVLRTEHERAWAARGAARAVHEPSGTDLPLPLLRGTQALASAAMRRGDHAGALPALELVEVTLAACGEDRLAVEGLELLADTLSLRADCELHLRRRPDAVATAHRAAALHGRLSRPLQRAYTLHGQAQALHFIGDLGAAADQLRRVEVQYAGLSETADALRARRDLALVRLSMGDGDAAKCELLAVLARAERLPPRARYPALVFLAWVSLRTRDRRAARTWAERAERIAERHPAELGDFLEAHNPLQDRRDQVDRELRAASTRTRGA